MLTNNPCNKCNSGCTDNCTCHEPVYVAASNCDEPLSFNCVEITENGQIYPCLGLTKGNNLSDLTKVVDQWKCEYEILKTKVKVSPNDKTVGYLSQKIVSGECITFQVIDQGNDERLKPVIDWTCVLSKLVLLPGFCNTVSACTPAPQCSPTTNLSVV